ncbi:hypothetical protein DGN07_12070 [Xanthomonas citri pv. fuscans]|nr:hypothetical protein DGN07_12070 [Xanthomonas citri pv. fuscans]
MHWIALPLQVGGVSQLSPPDASSFLPSPPSPSPSPSSSPSPSPSASFLQVPSLPGASPAAH